MLIAFQQQVTVITIHVRKNDGPEKKNFFFVFSHPGGSVSLPGVQEVGCISGSTRMIREGSHVCILSQ